MDRMERALEEVQKKRLKSAVILKPQNIFYLTGFYPSTFSALILGKEPGLLITRMDKGLLPDNFDLDYKAVDNFKKEFRKIPGKKIGIEKSYASISFLEKNLKDKKAVEISFVEEMRKIKDKNEIELIKEALKVTESTLGKVEEEIRNREQTERELAAFIEYRFKSESDGPAFDTIVASGGNSSVPHHFPGGKTIDEDPILIDLGAKNGHYMSDLTRTFGNMDGICQERYAIVLEAQKAGIAECFSGNEVKNVDMAVLKVFKEYNMEKYFLHSPGHGVGIEVHEGPRLSFKSKEIFQEGMVVAVEPGLYKDFGIRIEDMVLVGKKPKVLSSYRK